MTIVTMTSRVTVPEDVPMSQVEAWLESAYAELESHFDSVDSFTEINPEYCVYEYTTGTAWRCFPATAENATREAALAGESTKAMPLKRAEALAEAWAYGRRYEIQQRGKKR